MRRRELVWGSHALWTLVAGAAAVVITVVMLGEATLPGVYVLAEVLFLAALGAGVVRPDGAWPAAGEMAVLAWWLVGGAHTRWWWAVAVALGIAAYHLATAWAAQAPRWAVIAEGYRPVLLRRFCAYLALCLGACLLVAALGSLGAVPMWAAGIGGIAVAAGAIIATLRVKTSQGEEL